MCILLGKLEKYALKCRVQIHTSKLWVCHPTLLLDIVPPSPIINFWKFCRPMLLFQPMPLLETRE